ncbi:2-polyprenyl-6-methoxyphenol hydroxylase [Pedobacter westerhofensis]|uniref:2-polyprenyl-6-methoxyphenol hydroxylase n=1 Tax=Pedobacter westerhofensis TaxID=425512 RepID=A0A521BDZ3_9SPHI|nr:FAD-dependent monooxygenase [Pedobacter westerhofensis]SMO45279.1 2-polyprenyl-6-methoxyphenol hydroxylase [Pedobacter westerhofensis]
MTKKDVKKILVSGASVAGPTLAYWLHYYGFEVTVVERSAGLRLGGQNVDVKGPALQVIKRMGIEKEVIAANTTEIGLRFVNVKNETIGEFPKESALSMTQELEILRGDLVSILHQHTKDDVQYIFGDYITRLAEDQNAVAVTFASGKQVEFDLVISAEGIGSGTRKLVFAEEAKYKYLGLYTAYLTIQKTGNDSRWARWCNTAGGIVFLLRPDSYGTTRAAITFASAEMGYEKLPVEEQKAVLIQRIKNAGWESERLAGEIKKSEDLYFDRVSQVKMTKWSIGRCCLTGDAAWCVTPIAGKGIDLAMSGAYILAGELSRTENYREAFTNYENRMRNYVEDAQKLPPFVPGIVYPRSKFGVSILNAVVSFFASRPVQSLINLFNTKKKKKVEKHEIELPDYG